MTSQRDLERRLMEYLDQGPTMVPNSRYDVVRSQIDQTRQRVVIGPWKEEQVSRYVEGEAIVVRLSDFVDSPADLRQELQSIVDSIVISAP